MAYIAKYVAYIANAFNKMPAIALAKYSIVSKIMPYFAFFLLFKTIASPMPAFAQSPANILPKVIPPLIYNCVIKIDDAQLGISPTSEQTKG